MEYAGRLYRICRQGKTVDNSEKTDETCAELWITVWTVWKCIRIYTEPTGMNIHASRPEPAKSAENKGIAPRAVRFPGCIGGIVLQFDRKHAILKPL